MPQENSENSDEFGKSANNPCPKREKNMQELKNKQKKDFRIRKQSNIRALLEKEIISKSALAQVIRFYTKAIAI